MADPAVTILFEGQPLACRPGQSVAAALWDHGVKVLSHSPKYGRPRGASCARGHCMGCLMRIDGVPNVRACNAPVREGQRVERQDAGAVYGRPMQAALANTGHLLPVGFYYKWFTKPTAVAKLFMRAIRPVAGIGRLPDEAAWRGAPPPPRSRDLGRWDTVVVGGGAAGLAAVLAGEGRTLLIDDSRLGGGQRREALDLAAAGEGDPLAGLHRLRRLRAVLHERDALVAAAPHVTRAAATTVVGCYQPDMLLVRDATGLAVARADRIVWAAGALDQLGLFDDHDLPGVMGPRALYRLAGRDGIDLRGRSAVVWGHGPDQWLSAALLHARGAQVVLALDPTAAPDDDALATAGRLGWRLLHGVRPAAALGRAGSLAALRFDDGQGGARREAACELAVMCGRGKPVYDGAYQLGADLVLDPLRGGYVPRGAVAGRWDGDTPAGLRLTIAGESAGATLADLLQEVTP
ncbi:MAG: (2Fe-2S)-binding protein [bacterium]|nr:(2Fe-2S)-binding protein [bacterium]MBK9305273.1 (2Fe-2S)-binding protein [bacterium]